MGGDTKSSGENPRSGRDVRDAHRSAGQQHPRHDNHTQCPFASRRQVVDDEIGYLRLHEFAPEVLNRSGSWSSISVDTRADSSTRR